MSEQVHLQLLQATKGLVSLRQAIENNGVMSLSAQQPVQFFIYLARSVAAQQLSNAAASTIWSRVIKAAGSEAGLYDFCVESHYQQLRGCGLSNSKVKTILGLRSALESGELGDSLFQSQDRKFITQELTKLWGIGPWTADMAAIFFFALPNIWAPGDAALVRGLEFFASKEGVEPTMILKLTEPYHSYLALHIWHCWDTDILTG